MVTKFMEMVNRKIESEEFLTVCMKYGDFSVMDSIIPYSINGNNNICIKCEEFMEMVIPANSEIVFDEYEEEYVIKYGESTLYFS